MELTRNSALGILAIIFFAMVALTQVAHAEETQWKYAQYVGSGGYSNLYGHHNFDSTPTDAGWTFLTHMTGLEEIPSVSTQSVGDGGVWYGGNGTGMRAWTIVWGGDNVTMAHLHCGAVGENGPPVVTLFRNDAGVDVNGVLAHVAITNDSIMDADCASVIGYNIYTAHDLAHAIEYGDIYMNVHDKAHPNGVIRGQFAAQIVPGGGYPGSADDSGSSHDGHGSHHGEYDSDDDSDDGDDDHGGDYED